MKFISGQFTSFVSPMKDIDYMCCYYNSISIKHDEISQCQSKSNFTATVGITVIPFIIRVIMVIY